MNTRSRMKDYIIDFQIRFPFSCIQILTTRFASHGSPLKTEVTGGNRGDGMSGLEIRILPSLPGRDQLLHCFERPSVLTGQYFQAMCLVVISSQNNFHVAASHRFCIFILNPTRIRGTEDSFLIPVHSLGFIFDNGLFQIAESYLRLQ